MKLAVLLVLFLVVHCSALAQQTTRGAYDLTAYRPQHGRRPPPALRGRPAGAYYPFARTAVPDAFEEDNDRGPGIRVNSADERDPTGEDSLIEEDDLIARWL